MRTKQEIIRAYRKEHPNMTELPIVELLSDIRDEITKARAQLFLLLEQKRR